MKTLARRIGSSLLSITAAGTLIATLTPGTASATTTSSTAEVPCRAELFPVGGTTVHGYPAGYQAWLTCASPVQMMNLKIERARYYGKINRPIERTETTIVANKKRIQIAGPIEVRFDIKCEQNATSRWQAVAVIRDVPGGPKRTIRSPQYYRHEECGFYWLPPEVS